MSRFATFESLRLRAASASWALAQAFWVGGLWLLHFVVLPGLDRIGLAPLLIEEIAAGLRPTLVGFAGFCALFQALLLAQVTGFRGFWRDPRGQLLLIVLGLAIGHFAGRTALVASGGFWPVFSYLSIAFCGVLLALQPVPNKDVG
ncbi:DUF4149 domain-containing protein [Stutzerimonas urumqiensis]|uniref:DUF4149 domain-containing protein n=1 Tax=Stutzerimonas urumqiensis TaxID=638269 RepID=UPI003DA67266